MGTFPLDIVFNTVIYSRLGQILTYALPSCPNKEKVADFHTECKNTSVALHASQDIPKLQVRQNMPHRIYTKYKRRRTCLTGYIQITGAAQPATQVLHKLQVVYSVLPSQKAVGNRFSYLTGSTHNLQVGHVLCTFYP